MSNPPTDAAQALAERDTAEAHRAAAAADAPTPTRLMESAQAERDQLRAANARLLAIIGADTPIAAFSLAATWQAEKAGYMERVEALTLALDEQARELADAQRLLAIVRKERDSYGAGIMNAAGDYTALEAAARTCRAALLSAPDMHDRMVRLSTAIHAYDEATHA